MAAITDKLYELESTLEGMVEGAGKDVPSKGDLSDIVSHLDYIIDLLGTMVSANTFAQIKEQQKNGYNGISDRADTINELLKTGEISGDVDLYPMTITENGTYQAGAGKGFSKVVVAVESTEPGNTEP